MPKLVIVDADASFAESVTHLLAPHGFKTVVTGDGDSAVDVIKNERPDVLLVNVELSKGSGYSLCNRVKRNADTQPIPFILTSTQATPEAFAQHQKLPTRAESYLRKPFGLDQLLGVMQQLAPAAFGGNGRNPTPAPGMPATRGPAGDDDDVLSVQEKGAALDGDLGASLDAAFGGGEPGQRSESSAGGPPALPPSGGPPPLRNVRPGRSARGPSLDELLRTGRPDDGPASLPPTAGPEAKQQFLRDSLRRREADLARARELWAAREREVNAMEDALDQRTRDLETARDELRDTQVRLTTAEERIVNSTAELAILEERVTRMEREKDALIQDGENAREAHEHAIQAEQERYAALDDRARREKAELEQVVAERNTDIETLNQRIEGLRAEAERETQAAHDREMQLQREKEALRAELDEERGTREGVQALLRTETEERVKVEGRLADLQRAKENADNVAAKNIKELQQKVAALTKERSDLEVERENALADLAQRADQIARLETQIADLEANLAEEQGKVTDLERTVYERNHHIEEQNGELNARAARIKLLEQEVERGLQRASTLEARLAEMRDAQERENRERSETERQLREDIAQLEATAKERELRIQTMDADNARLTTALDSSRAERDSLAERLGERDAELAEEQRNHTQTRERLEGQLTREKKSAADQKAAADRKDADQQGKILKLETELASTTEKLRTTENDLQAIRTKAAEIERALRQTRATLDETSAEREQLRGQVQDYQGQIRRKSENEARLSSELGQAQARISGLEQEVESLRAQHGLEKGELDAARTKLEERARARITELSEQIADFKNQLEDARSQGESHQVHAQALENELLAMRAERDSEARSRVDAESRLEQLTKSLADEKAKRELREREQLAIKKNLETATKMREQLQQDLASSEARHKVELETLRGELRAKERAVADLGESAAREKASKEREKQGMVRALEDEKRSLTGKVEELSRRLERAEARASSAETEANSERSARVRERAASNVNLDAMKSRVEALEQQVAAGVGGAASAELEKRVSDATERIEELEGELQMITATLQDSQNKNKKLQEEMARKTVGGAEAAELRRKYNELVARYKTREEERKKLTEDYQKALEQLGRLKGGAGAAVVPPGAPKPANPIKQA